ncbi:MAG: hypothetical protein GXO33_08165 [Epsilonproteobacteria bacterium]|nr:hypothetical protein [Campylobacterota bacterium]
MKYPFDMYKLQLRLDHFLLHPDDLPHYGKHYWIYAWAHLFRWLGIGTEEIFERVYIIHRTQIIFTFFSLFYLSYTLAEKLFRQALTKTHALYLAYVATLLWFLFFATASVGEHHVWIQWYSINYQIALPMVLLALALTIRILFDPLDTKKRLLYLCLTLFLLLIVGVIHTMELIYYFLYLFTLLLLFYRPVFAILRRRPLLSLTVFVLFGVSVYYLVFFVVPTFTHRKILLIHYLANHDFAGLKAKILRDGHMLLSKFNRSWTSVHLLYPASLLLWTLMLLSRPFAHRLNLPSFDRRFWFFLVVTSLFAYIPLNLYTAGVASSVTYLIVTYRFYFSSLIFLALPFTTYYFLYPFFKRRPGYWIVAVFVLEVAICVTLSKVTDRYHHNFAKNVAAFFQLFDERASGYQLSAKQRAQIGRILLRYGSKKALADTKIFAREDIAFVIRHVYGYRNVYLPGHWNGRHINVNGYLEAYRKYKGKKVLIPVPPGFPEYTPYH